MAESILSLRHIGKTFPGVRALDDVSVDFLKGEVHGIVGENGAGKSTLMKILSGVYSLDEGEIYLDGRKEELRNPKDALLHGQSIIFQEFNLVNTLSISENIFLGRLPNTWINWKKIDTDAEELLHRVGCNVSPRTLVNDLSVAQKQMVEIAKALSYHARVVIMDEPSATLTASEVQTLFQIVDSLKQEGVTIIYISHKLEEVFEICDRVTVMRDGKIISTRPVSEYNRERIIREMVGREVNQEYPCRSRYSDEEAPVVLEVRELKRSGVFENISFSLRNGEVLGLAGLVGSGRTEIVRAIFGADRLDGGKLFIHGQKVRIRIPADSISHKMALLTEDRKQQGLILQLPVTNNVSIAGLKKIAPRGLMHFKKERLVAQKYVEMLKIKTPSCDQKVLYLSGGNQQKVLFSRWLFVDSDIIILDEPTRGIDVGAKSEIYQIINDLVTKGKSIILISSDMPELLAMSDRVMIVSEGRIKGELSGSRMTPDEVMETILRREERDQV